MNPGDNRIAVDWDGTCVESAWPAMGGWIPGAQDALRDLLDAGYQIVVYTCRIARLDEDEHTPRDSFGISDEVMAIRTMLNEENLHDVRIWREDWKPRAVAYIDDRAIEFVGDWPAIVGRILARGHGQGAREAESGVARPVTGQTAGDGTPMADSARAPARHPNSQRFHDILGELSALHDRKQADYGRGDDPFANVRGSTEWGVPAWVGAMIRATDKVRRLQTQAMRGSLSNESALDAFDDLAVYAVIARVLFEEAA